ncbi:twin-arginine translocase TatA/TatE family subunit [Natronorubrum bangense]|uniref:Twin-arginine translocation protein, TatA/E family subunit n=2 Tax=Natronorubrum bangense TaxID=61858 RepID=L9WFJ0_9EURY|nr:twin-arginine translocase TatA/TatE family subunit [Natronorubrum bangense]ELY48026.1 twin-arginine translocation protein, TatA/E family subunit [Natronorubrum bangense JCM 10635]QCC53518.1 twin-arginine translocase TatA/TatE family subunit [Natronorubrum bangense]
MVAEIAPLFIPGVPGGPELLIILFIAILLFGANKIPKLARSTGEAMGEFQKGREKVETELEEMRESGFEEDDGFEEGEFDDDDEFVDTEPVTEESDSETETETK